jgi:hypothetical protein
MLLDGLYAPNSWHRRALQISANDDGAHVELLHVSDGSVKIKLTDVT